ncbi:MAG: BtpA/SgcQ family protein [Phycisphaerae bacterium]
MSRKVIASARILPPMLIGMVHVPALPATPAARLSIAEIIDIACYEAHFLESIGFDAILIENMHDAPYLYQTIGPEITAAMTAICARVRAAVKIELGVQVLAACNREALAVALASNLNFIRAENFAFAHVADEGLMPTADAGPLLRYRRQIGADHIRIYADVKKKHAAHAITGDVSLDDAVHGAIFCGADGVIITGSATGKAAAPADVAAANRAGAPRVLVGSGITAANLHQYWPIADGFIVGSSLKFDGDWRNDIDASRAAELVARARELSGTNLQPVSGTGLQPVSPTVPQKGRRAQGAGRTPPHNSRSRKRPGKRGAS